MLTFLVFRISTVKTSDESPPRTKQLRKSVDIVGGRTISRALFRVELPNSPRTCQGPSHVTKCHAGSVSVTTKHVIHFRYVTYPNSSSSFAAFTWATTTTTILTLLESHLNCDTRLNLDSQLPVPPHRTIAASITIGSATRGVPLMPELVATNRGWRWHIAEAAWTTLRRPHLQRQASCTVYVA